MNESSIKFIDKNFFVKGLENRQSVIGTFHVYKLINQKVFKVIAIGIEWENLIFSRAVALLFNWKYFWG